jgi:hypothetical protein
MWDADPEMHTYAQGSDLDALIARPHGDPARPNNDMCIFASSRSAGCPSAERKVLTTPTGGASSAFAPVGAEAPLAQLRHPGRADPLKRRRKVRDEILGREGKPSQSPSRKGRRQTLNRCLVQSACEVDASFQKDSLHPLAERQAASHDVKLKIVQSTFGVRPLDLRDHIEVRPVCQEPQPATPWLLSCFTAWRRESRSPSGR